MISKEEGDGFLLPPAPSCARARKIDFATTDPPLPGCKDLFAVVIDDLLTAEECQELIHRAEASTPDGTATWERAQINIGGGRQMLAADVRNSSRIMWDSPKMAQKVLDRLMPFLQTFELDQFTNRPRVTGLAGRGKSYRLARLNERLRFLRYEGGEYFRPHWDGKYKDPATGETSYYTIHLYLNGEGEQDLDGLIQAQQKGQVNADLAGTLLGGATSFMPSFEEQHKQVRIFPRTGSVLIFQQNDLLHSGDQVFRGTKFTMRTDIMYRQQ